ncbi:hypothetical protein [Azospirillum picis]|uniref:Uncharacterized protein n=1 Tax=Azospirillum picis TaxID=488438 RepID=A0ABU0MQD3_9PROT|nr:hypothetical protein [Azospirillum picis]MBP2301566.1 hypothetical protein [Azospirillum picis]MDQ0535398.1 hypothetical protein [Azospirillum picis]
MADLQEDINRGQHAQRLLDDPLLVEAFAQLEADYIAGWRSTGARDTDARERLWQAVQIVGKVKAHLEKVAAHGKLADAEAAEIARMGERQKLFGLI